MSEIITIKVSFTNCFLVKAKKGYLMIDTSYPNKYASFLRKLQKRKIDLKEIKYLLLTHHHDDHAGFAAELVKDTGAKIIAQEQAIPYLEKGQSEEESKPVNCCIRTLLGAFTLFHKFTYPPVKVTDRDLIIKKDNFKLLKEEVGIDGMILHTPGHTRDSISVVLADGKAFVGDLAMNMFNICRIKSRPIVFQSIEEVFH